MSDGPRGQRESVTSDRAQKPVSNKPLIAAVVRLIDVVLLRLQELLREFAVLWLTFGLLEAWRIDPKIDHAYATRVATIAASAWLSAVWLEWVAGSL